ncbi:MAG: Hsp70 family protein [Oscillospiraceae bacterium]|nr:Hsp70 family protein [Oscillospiraceae bacterium]
MSISVGIDLGTTFSAVAYIDPKSKSPQIIPNREGKKITPSVIQFLDGEMIFGSEAEDAYNAGEPNCVATFKREMGNDEPYCYIDGVPYTSEKLSSLLLRHLKENAEEVLGESIKDAVITVPAYFYSREREATYRAAEAAGLKVKKIIDEPNAAAMAYGLTNWRENANILVYDLGGGTFDVTLVHMGKNGELSTITTRGNHQLGGRDWDNRIEDLLFDRFESETDLDLRSDPDLSAIIRGMCEDVKKNLSVMTTVKATASFPNFGRASVLISRQEFEESTSDLLERTGSLCQAVLDEAGITIKNVTDILLVGGSTRMPQVSNYIQKLFGKKPITHVNPDEAVALGAAIQSSKKNTEYASLSVQVVEGKKVTDRSKSGLNNFVAVKPAHKLDSINSLSLRETTAHALGVVAVNDEENCYYNEVIIPANHPRPVRAAKRFRYYTSSTSNNTLDVYMVQGDNPNPTDCIIPYKYVVSGIQHVNKGEKIGTVIRVQYSYDDNGIIHVQARQGDSNRDLPIRKDDAPRDISKFGHPINSADNKRDSSMGLMMNHGGSGGVIHKYKAVTFSNVEWEKYDNIPVHPSGAEFNEPTIHVVANEKQIEFHGYNVSQMDEGVTYTIDSNDDFEIECNIDTSTIQPHPGGFLKILLGIISANLNQNGGNILLDGEGVAMVGSKFNLKMSLSDGGHYEVYVDGKLVGSKVHETSGGVDVTFGFEHDSHCCSILSHAYISNIDMMQCADSGEDESAETPTWDD